MSAEIEVKLIIEAEALQKLLASPLITEKIVPGSEAVQHLATSYYDTAAYSLMKNGIAYRVRQNGDKFEATIKTEKEAHGAFSSRNEYNIDLPDATPVLQGFEAVGFNRDLAKITGALTGIWQKLPAANRCKSCLPSVWSASCACCKLRLPPSWSWRWTAGRLLRPSVRRFARLMKRSWK